jgi:hypothetical protein
MRDSLRLRSGILRLLAAAAFIAAVSAVSAQAPKPTPGLTPVEGLENWKQILDLGGYAPGKYNLVVEGRDKAGNITRATPMNIYVDPKSDLPIAAIINPAPLMRVGGDLHIVGTAADDDGVGKVEISLDGGEYFAAEGAEFWSYDLKTAAMPEGRRTLDVRAVDVNGLAGPSVRVAFDLDRTKPLASVASPAMGSLVSGQIKLSGSVFDANGLRSLEISRDGGGTWEGVSLKRSRDGLNASFSWPVDTRKLADGPRVFSLRSTDGVGSVSVGAYLVVVDNTVPAIEVARPQAGSPVNGRFALAGAVRDSVGVKRLAYELGTGEKGEIPLTAGDPFFVKELDLSSVKGNSVGLVLLAEDSIGNVTRLSVPLKIDRRADMPVLKALGPQAAGAGAGAAARLREGEAVWGSITDDDGVSAFRWSLDGGAPTEVPCSETFSLVLPGASPGRHALTLVPLDSNKLAGDPVVIALAIDKGPGAIAFERLASAKESRDFVPGMEVAVDSGESLEGSVAAPNPLVSSGYSVAEGKDLPLALEKADSSGRQRFKIPIGAAMPYGFAPVTVWAKDQAGNEFRAQALLYVTDYAVAREEAGFRFPDPRIDSEGRIALGKVPLVGAFYGGELASLRFDPATDIVAAGFDGRAVSIAPVKEGVTAPTRVLGKTKQGREFASAPMIFVTDSTPPVLELEAPAEGSFFNGRLSVKGRATNALGPAALSWRRLPDGERKTVDLGKDGSFSFDLSAPDFPAGAFSIELEAKNQAGRVARAYRSLVADSKGPSVSFLAPEKGAAVWGPEDVAARIDSASGVQSVEFAADGKSFAPIESNGIYFAHRADFAANPSAAYRVKDKAGNLAVFRPEVKIEKAPDRLAASPTVSVEPAAGEPKVELAGTAGALKASLLLPALSEADYAALGAADAPPPARFATRLLAPGALALKGQATAEGKLKSVALSADGGATWKSLAAYKDEKSAKKTLPFALSLPAAQLPSGAARWAIKVEDFSGAAYLCPLYFLFDAKAPSLVQLFPEPGASAMPGAFPLVVKAEDENGLSSLELGLGPAAKEGLDAAAGGRYFVRMLDPRSTAKGAAVQAALSAKDAAGNHAALSAKLGYDAALDAPKLREDGLVAEAGGLVSGLAADDDGLPAVKLSIDGGEAASFAAGAYAFALPELSVGKHLLSIEVEGAAAPTKREFAIKDLAPTLGDFKFVSGKSSNPWSPGIELQLGAASVFSGTVSSGNGVSGVTVSFNGGSGAAASLGKAAPGAPQSFSLPVPAALPCGRVVVEIEAKDASGQSRLQRIELHKVLPSAVGIDDGEGIRFADSRVSIADGKTSFLLAPGEALRGRFNGRPIKAVALKPATQALKASFEGPLVAIAGKAEGLAPETSLELTTVDGDLFSWGPFSAAVDSSPPSIEVSAPTDGDWLKGELRVAGKASDPQGIALLQASVNGGDPLSLLDGAAPKEGASAGSGASFDKVLSLASAPDGSTRIDFLARDGAGREARVSRFINKDTVAPALTQVLPAPGESVNGLTTFIGEAADAGRLVSAVFLAPAAKKAESPLPAAEAPATKRPATTEEYLRSMQREKPAAPEPKPQEPSQKPVEAKAEEVQGLASFSRDLDLARLEMPLPEGCGFAVTDKAGNRTILAPAVVVDREKDKPVAEIHTPGELEVLRGDFAISGVAYDDDGLAAAYYRIDGGEWTRLEIQGMAFSVPIALKDTTDNEHGVEVKAEDIYGVQGDVVARKYRISKEEPLAKMLLPSIAKPVRGTVRLEGSASDANGVKDATVSVDNRTSYENLVGAESWSIELDTSRLSDGIHAVAVRPVDGYDTEGFYASMIAIDNTPPKAQVDLPRDGEEIASSLFVSGRVSDNLAIASSRIEVAPIGEGQPPAIVVDLGTERIVQRSIDVSGLRKGIYAVRLVVRDRADNESVATRDVAVTASAPLDAVTILFPVEGARLSGKLRIQGRATVASGAQTVSILADGAVLGAAEPDQLGWYSLDLPAGALSDGDHVLRARTSAKDGRVIESRDSRLAWKTLGPWVSIESFNSGKYLEYRPYLKGAAGWAAEEAPAGDKQALAAYKKEAEKREIVQVDVSLDDGMTFRPAKGKEKWSFRLETQDFKEGPLHAIVRARYADGTLADSKGLYFLDKTPPEVQVLTPAEGGRFNGSLDLQGRSFDLNGMSSVGVSLRKGDKSRYEVPSFIQGLYFDGQALGATTWQAGVGLTFFSDNVKVQALYGKAPETYADGEAQSFYGDVFGGKIIANVAYLPFGSFLGPDWDFLSASLGIGANFSYFSKTQAGSGLIVGSVFGQLEFPKVTLRNSSVFKKFSLYTEYQMWVLSSVVSGGFIQKLSFGARLGVF